MSIPPPIANIAAYQFVTLADPETWQILVRRFCLQHGLVGTVLLAEEGINLMLAGQETAIDHFETYLQSQPPFVNITFKRSHSDTLPFNRLIVKVKPEIIRMDHPEIKPGEHTAPHLAPEVFQEWLDAGKDMVVLDTRNRYEIEVGTLRSAEHLNIDNFRTFPEACEKLPAEYRDKPIVTFCTGGIRCEKAAEYLVQSGYREVYQLDGGILNYFKICGGKDWHGECFVFDNRVSVDTNLAESARHKHLLGESKSPFPLD